MLIQWNNSTLICTLNHLERGNSFRLEDAIEIDKAIKKHGKNLRALILKNEGRVFCGGGNLEYYRGLKDLKGEGNKANQKIKLTLQSLDRLPVPTLCLIDGDCIGGGIELISCFDHIVASPKSEFHFWQIRLALSYGWGGATRLSRRMPVRKVETLLTEAGTLSSFEAKQNGLIDGVLPIWKFESYSHRWIEEQLSLPPHARIRSKMELRRNQTPAAEEKLFKLLWGAPEHKSKLKNPK